MSISYSICQCVSPRSYPSGLAAQGLVTLKPGIVLETLQAQAKVHTDLAVAQAMQGAKCKLFASFVKPKCRA